VAGGHRLVRGCQVLPAARGFQGLEHQPACSRRDLVRAGSVDRPAIAIVIDGWLAIHRGVGDPAGAVRAAFGTSVPGVRAGGHLICLRRLPALDGRVLGGRQNVPGDLQQPFGLGAVLLTQLFQPVLVFAVDDRHALAEHVGDLVPCGRAQDVDQAGQQGQPLGLAGKVPDLPRWDAVQPVLGGAEGVQRLRVLQALLELRQGRRLRRVLQLVEAAAPGRRAHHHQLMQAGPEHRIDPARHDAARLRCSRNRVMWPGRRRHTCIPSAPGSLTRCLWRRRL